MEKTIHIFTNILGPVTLLSFIDTKTNFSNSVVIDSLYSYAHTPVVIRHIPKNFVTVAIEQGGFYFNRIEVNLFSNDHTPIELFGKSYILKWEK